MVIRYDDFVDDQNTRILPNTRLRMHTDDCKYKGMCKCIKLIYTASKKCNLLHAKHFI